MTEVRIINADCLQAADHLPDECVDLGIFDPPFGIGEGSFNKHYKRDSSCVVKGYQEAPEDYEGYFQWTLRWLTEAIRVLKPSGSMYVIMGHSNVRALLNAAASLGLHEVNHLIWKFNFGVHTTKKYVTSHYHVLYYTKGPSVTPTFNTNCRFGAQEEAYQGGKRLYQDLEDVFYIQRDNRPGEEKNQNKLPDLLIQKIVQYSSNPGDVVCDFFMGNFTTAYVARRLGRKVCGFEVNPNAYNLHLPKVQAVLFGEGLPHLREVVNEVPGRQGEPISEDEVQEILARYTHLRETGVGKQEVSKTLQKEFQRGRFAIKNILDRALPKHTIAAEHTNYVLDTIHYVASSDTLD